MVRTFLIKLNQVTLFAFKTNHLGASKGEKRDTIYQSMWKGVHKCVNKILLNKDSFFAYFMKIPFCRHKIPF